MSGHSKKGGGGVCYDFVPPYATTSVFYPRCAYTIAMHCFKMMRYGIQLQQRVIASHCKRVLWLRAAVRVLLDRICACVFHGIVPACTCMHAYDGCVPACLIQVRACIHVPVYLRACEHVCMCARVNVTMCARLVPTKV